MKNSFYYIDHGEGGLPSCMKLLQRSLELPRKRQVLIKVAYSGVNRPDIMLRTGSYPPPQGASPYLGLEVSGTIAAVGPDVRNAKIGDAVCALVPGGGYAEYCLTDERHCLPVPKVLSMREAACLPENYFTVWANVFECGRLTSGESILVHGGSSGIGLATIKLSKAFGASVWTTVGSRQKADACKHAGADHVILYHEDDFLKNILLGTQGQGVDLILDMVGGDYIDKNIQALTINGRLVQIAFLKGSRAVLDAAPIMKKRLTFTGSTLRPRSDDDKADIANSLKTHVLPLIIKGQCLPVIDSEFSLAEACKAHELMESSQHIGKIILNVKDLP